MVDAAAADADTDRRFRGADRVDPAAADAPDAQAGRARARGRLGREPRHLERSSREAFGGRKKEERRRASSANSSAFFSLSLFFSQVMGVASCCCCSLVPCVSTGLAGAAMTTSTQKERRVERKKARPFLGRMESRKENCELSIFFLLLTSACPTPTPTTGSIEKKEKSPRAKERLFTFPSCLTPRWTSKPRGRPSLTCCGASARPWRWVFEKEREE